MCDQRGLPIVKQNNAGAKCIYKTAYLRKYSARSCPVPHGDEVCMTTDKEGLKHVEEGMALTSLHIVLYKPFEQAMF